MWHTARASTCIVRNHATYVSHSVYRHLSTAVSSPASLEQVSPFAPRHLLSIADLSTTELVALIHNARSHKQAVKSGYVPRELVGVLAGKTVAMMFSKRSTRTRVSTETAVSLLGGHPMFLGKDDIQLGVNESVYDTSIVVSSMVSAIVARVHGHAEVAELAKSSSTPVINALSDLYHPMQTIADFLTVVEAFPSRDGDSSQVSLGLEGLKIAWIGDSSNVLFDLAIGAGKLGIDIAVATPTGYEVPQDVRKLIADANSSGSAFIETTSPEEAVKNASVIVTDTWVSMGQEGEKARRLQDFRGFQVTRSMIERGGASPAWKFMHCLPRKPDEVDDDVFYDPVRSLVFQEAENRLWAAVSVLEAFVVKKGLFV